MIIFPAVDLKNGKAVRLKQGKADQVSVFSDDPVQMAKHWQSLGAGFPSSSEAEYARKKLLIFGSI